MRGSSIPVRNGSGEIPGAVREIGPDRLVRPMRERRMQRIHQIAALCFLAFSIAVVIESLSLEYYTKLGPGAGFFPFWLGTLTGVLSFAWLVQVSREAAKSKEGPFFPQKAGLYQILSILASLLMVAGLMNVIGFQLTMLLFLVFLLKILGRQSIWATLIIAVLGSIGVFHLFGRYLDVPLPVSSLTFLASLGL